MGDELKGPEAGQTLFPPLSATTEESARPLKKTPTNTHREVIVLKSRSNCLIEFVTDKLFRSYLWFLIVTSDGPAPS